MAVTAATITPRIEIRCPHCAQIVAWRLVRSGVLVPVIAANVSDESVGVIRILCHGCKRRTRVKVVEA